VLVPGMGDLRAGYRFLAPALRAAGYRVACTDLRPAMSWP
jgi:alpha-beta hydrolase superfamily lysophospholipase